MALEIRTRLPQIQLRVTYPRVDTEVRYPKVRIDQDQPRVIIDQTAPLGEIGLKSSLDLARSAKRNAQEKASQAIESYVYEGDQYLEVHKGVTVGQVVAALTQGEIPELNVEALPKSRPSIEVEGDLSIHMEPGRVESQVHMGSVDLFVQQGSVTVSTKDVPRMGETVDLRI